MDLDTHTQLGELGRNRYTFAKNQQKAALEIDALGVYADTARIWNAIAATMRTKLGGETITEVDRLEDSLVEYDRLVADATVLMEDALRGLRIRPYRGRGHRGLSSLESWELAVEIDLGDMRRLLPRLEDSSLRTGELVQAALAAVQQERTSRGEQGVKPWRPSPPRRRIDWNAAGPIEVRNWVKAAGPIALGFKLGGATALIGLAALWFVLGRR